MRKPVPLLTQVVRRLILGSCRTEVSFSCWLSPKDHFQFPKIMHISRPMALSIFKVSDSELNVSHNANLCPHTLFLFHCNWVKFPLLRDQVTILGQISNPEISPKHEVSNLMKSEKSLLYKPHVHRFWVLEYFDMDISYDSVQFSRSVVSDSLRPHELHHARPPCPSSTPSLLKLVHWVGDAIQPSHHLSSPFSPTFNLS